MDASKTSSSPTEHALSVVKLPISGFQGPYQYYRFEIPLPNGTQTLTFLLSYKLSLRLWRRFLESAKDDVTVTKTVFLGSAVPSGDEHSTMQMPGEGCSSFLQALSHALLRKHKRNDIEPSWSVSSSLYKLWLFTSQVSTEMFADCFNESGVMKSYCSVDALDADFGALGRWEEHENSIEGGAANPPLNVDLISNILRCFERGVQSNKPYCRVVLLPLGEGYGVKEHINSITSEGELLLTIPPGSFPFTNDRSVLSTDYLNCRETSCHSLGIFVWCNREYLLKFKPPCDIEDLYQVWVDNFLCNPEKVTLDRDAFIRAFPAELRSAERWLGFFTQEVMHPF